MSNWQLETDYQNHGLAKVWFYLSIKTCIIFSQSAKHYHLDNQCLFLLKDQFKSLLSVLACSVNLIVYCLGLKTIPCWMPSSLRLGKRPLYYSTCTPSTAASGDSVLFSITQTDTEHKLDLSHYSCFSHLYASPGHVSLKYWLWTMDYGLRIGYKFGQLCGIIFV